jgi:hypothetical protein
MPKISDDTLLRFAIPDAVLDRMGLAEAYHNTGHEATEATLLAEQFNQLKGVKLARMTAEQLETARLCFIYAEQYEMSRVDARIPAGRRWDEDPARRAASYKEVRTRRWGLTKLEAYTATAGTMRVMDFLDESRKRDAGG